MEFFSLDNGIVYNGTIKTGGRLPGNSRNSSIGVSKSYFLSASDSEINGMKNILFNTKNLAVAADLASDVILLKAAASATNYNAGWILTVKYQTTNSVISYFEISGRAYNGSSFDTLFTRSWGTSSQTKYTYRVDLHADSGTNNYNTHTIETGKYKQSGVCFSILDSNSYVHDVMIVMFETNYSNTGHQFSIIMGELGVTYTSINGQIFNALKQDDFTVTFKSTGSVPIVPSVSTKGFGSNGSNDLYCNQGWLADIEDYDGTTVGYMASITSDINAKVDESLIRFSKRFVSR